MAGRERHGSLERLVDPFDGHGLRGLGGECRGQQRRGGCDAAAGQSRTELLAAPRQPALDRPDRAADLRRGLLVRLALEIAEDDRFAVSRRQPIQLDIDQGSQLVRLKSVRVRFFHVQPLRPGPFASTPSPGVDLGTHRDASGDAVEPGSQYVALADRPGLLDQDQEGGLKGVGDVVRVIQDAPADAQDHRPMPMEDRLEGRLVAMGEESLQELSLGQTCDGPCVEQTSQ